MKFYPYGKRGWGGGKSISHAEGGGEGTTSFGTQTNSTLGAKSLPCLEGGRKKFWTRDFPIL